MHIIIRNNLFDNVFQEEEDLRNLQKQKWGPVLEWFKKRFNVTQDIAKGLIPPPVTADTRAVLAKYFLSYDLPALSGKKGTFLLQYLRLPKIGNPCNPQDIFSRI